MRSFNKSILIFCILALYNEIEMLMQNLKIKNKDTLRVATKEKVLVDVFKFNNFLLAPQGLLEQIC